MGVQFKSGPGFERALEIIFDFVTTCPHCGAEDSVDDELDWMSDDEFDDFMINNIF